MNAMRGVLAGLVGFVLLGAQPAIVVAGAQEGGPRVVAAVNSDLGGKEKARKPTAAAAGKAAKSSTSGKSKRSAPAIIAARSTAMAVARTDVTEADKLPAPPARTGARVKKSGR